MKANKENILTEIAQNVMGIDTLKTRNSDGLDFHDLSVETIRRALLAAFEAGAIQGDSK